MNEKIKDILEWIHTTINGKKYKRLWNASKGEWLTDWILEEWSYVKKKYKLNMPF